MGDVSDTKPGTLKVVVTRLLEQLWKEKMEGGNGGDWVNI